MIPKSIKERPTTFAIAPSIVIAWSGIRTSSRIFWLKKDSKENNDETKATANFGAEPKSNDDDKVSFDNASNDSSLAPPPPSQDIQTLLATAMNLVAGNDVLRDRIADALNVSAGLWQLSHAFKLDMNFIFYPWLLIQNVSLCLLTSFICLIFTRNNVCRLRSNNLGQPPPPFSVKLKGATASAAPFQLSSISIPIQWCQLIHQLKCKMEWFSTWNLHLHRAKQRRFKFRHCFLTLLLITLFFFKHSQAVHIVKSTLYALVQGDQSLDTFCQQNTWILYSTNLTKEILLITAETTLLHLQW